MHKRLEHIDASEKGEFGEKAFYLGQLIRKGFNVPRGFAMTSLDAASFANLPPPFAIRSSARDEDQGEFSQAGQYESFLGVNDPLPILTTCFQRSFSGSVIVQEMIESDFGGVCFSRALEDPERLAIELCLGRNVGATKGVGEIARITLRRSNLEVVDVDDDRGLLKNPLLSPSPAKLGRVSEVARTCLAIEHAFGFAVDVEWCVRGGELFILQARPITGTSTSQTIERIKSQTLNDLACDANNRRWAFWTDFSIGDMFRHPSRLFLDLVNEDRGPNWSARRVYKDLGLSPARKSPGPLFVSICDRAYIHVANYVAFLFPKFPYRVSHLFRLIFLLPTKFRTIRRQMYKEWDAQTLSQRKAQANSYATRNHEEMSLAKLWERFDFLMTRLSDEAIYAHLMSDVIAGISHGLFRACLRVLFGKKASDWEFRLTTGLIGNFNTETTLALHALAHCTITLDIFMQEFGHRGNPDWDLASPRWREDPDKVSKMAQASRNSGVDYAKQFATQVAVREAAEKELSDHLNARWHRRILASFVKCQLRYLQIYSPLREQTQSVVFAYIEALRYVIIAIAKRQSFAEDVFGLSSEEFSWLRKPLPDNARNDLEQKVAKRKHEALLSRRIYLPHQLKKRDLAPALFEPKQHAATSVLKGTKVSGGVCIGKARVVTDLSELGPLNAMDIVIAQFADPSYAQLLLCAGGLVLEQGSVYSHTAIIAREFGLPALVNVAQATRRIVDGQHLRLDADKGELWICGPATKP